MVDFNVKKSAYKTTVSIDFHSYDLSLTEQHEIKRFVKNGQISLIATIANLMNEQGWTFEHSWRYLQKTCQIPATPISCLKGSDNE